MNGDKNRERERESKKGERERRKKRDGMYWNGMEWNERYEFCVLLWYTILVYMRHIK